MTHTEILRDSRRGRAAMLLRVAVAALCLMLPTAVRAEPTRARAVSARSLALAACVLVSGCYHGSARTATPADLASQDDSWNRVDGVPPVRQIAREDCGAAALAMVLGYWTVPGTRADITAASPPTFSWPASSPISIASSAGTVRSWSAS